MTQALQAMFYRGHQDRMDYKPLTGAVVNGQVLDIGNIIAICTSPEGIANVTLGSLAITGVFKLACGNTTFSQGAPVYWDMGNATATGNTTFTRAGIADEAKVAGDDHVKTNINVLGA